jgi:hypothetical protein
VIVIAHPRARPGGSEDSETGTIGFPQLQPGPTGGRPGPGDAAPAPRRPEICTNKLNRVIQPTFSSNVVTLLLRPIMMAAAPYHTICRAAIPSEPESS